MATSSKKLQMEQWNGKAEELKEWLERFVIACDYLDIKPEKRVQLLSISIGPIGYGTLKNLFGDKLLETECATVIESLRTVQAPTKPVLLERLTFHSMIQTASETVVQFLTRIQRQAKLCKFLTSEAEEEAIRDRFMVGLKSDKAKGWIIEQGSKTAEEALSRVITMSEVDATQCSPNMAAECHSFKSRQQNFKFNQKKKPVAVCKRCSLKGHVADDCRTKCYKCSKIGHTSKNCKSGTNVRWLRESVQRDEPKVLLEIGNDECDSCLCVPFEFDTGAAVTVVSEKHVEGLLSERELSEEVEFTVANGQTEEARRVWVSVRSVSDQSPSPYPKPSPKSRPLDSRKGGGSAKPPDKCFRLPLYVTRNPDTPPLLGREWMGELYGHDWWSSVSKSLGIHHVNSVDQVIQNFRGEVLTLPAFQEGTGTVEKDIHLEWRAEATPRYSKARGVPISMRNDIDQEIDRLVADGTWKPVNSSQWASPVVPVRKGDGSVRLCGDYKATVNPMLDTTRYPLPSLEECLEGLEGDLFTKLDIQQAYNNLQLTEDDQLRLTVNTHRGLFAPTRLPFGVSSAGGLWQQTMDEILRGVPGVKCRVDDIVITAKDKRTHMDRVRTVVQKLSDAGLKCKREKCRIMVKEIDYLGYIISSEGIRPKEDKTRAIVAMEPPQDRKQLKSFLGAANYYRRFIPNFSEISAPLNEIDRDDVDFVFGEHQTAAFTQLKSELAGPRVLTSYHEGRKTILSTDSSSYAIGAVLSQVTDEGEKPVEFASRLLTDAERNYGMVEKEGLAIVWAVKKFHRYLYGTQFEIRTDHDALKYVFHPARELPTMTLSRLTRWALILSCYSYTIGYKQVPVADACSRLVSSGEYKGGRADDCCRLSTCLCDTQLTVHFLSQGAITKKKMLEESRKDPILAQVLEWTQSGWPRTCSEKELQPYFRRRAEISVVSGLLVWGHRVICPTTLRNQMIELIHTGHPGIERSKRGARSSVWWPGIDSELEDRVRGCEPCQLSRGLPPAELHSWEEPTKPWERVHADFFEFKSEMYLVVVDAFSNWVEVFPMKSTTSTALIGVMKQLITRYGIPIVFVSDNGPQFVSEEFTDWMKKRGVDMRNSPPYWPQANGLAEGYVNRVKGALKRGSLDDWMIQHRSTPGCKGASPAKLFLGREITKLSDFANPLLTPETRGPVPEKENKFSVGQEVRFRRNKAWHLGVITKVTGKNTVIVRGPDGRETLVTNNHMRKWNGKYNTGNSDISKPPEPFPDPNPDPVLPVSDQPPDRVMIDIVTPPPSAARKYNLRDRKGRDRM